MKDSKNCSKVSLESSKELTTKNYKKSLKLKFKNPMKDKSKELSEESNSKQTLKEKSKELSSEMYKKPLNVPSSTKSKHKSTHVDDIELLKNLIGVALDNANNFSDREVGKNGDGGYGDIDDEEDEDSDVDEDTRKRGDTSKAGKTRGLTKMLNIFKMKKSTKVDFNEHGQPDSNNYAKLGSFLGLIARNGQLTPLDHVDWRSMPIQFKNIQWHVVQQHFNIPLDGKKWVMMSLGRKWSNFKSLLKKEHYDVHDNDVDSIADRDPRVHPEHWKFLVKYWSSDKGKERCLKNKDSRAKQKLMHTTGRKSYARVRKEMKKEPKRHELFIRTHTRKNGEPLNEQSKDAIAIIEETIGLYPELVEKEAAKNDILAAVLGEEKNVRVRGFGLGPCPSDVWGAEISRNQALKMLAASLSNENSLKNQVSEMGEKMEKLLERVDYLEKKRK